MARRTALGAAAWTAPAIAVVAATPAYASSAVRTLERVAPPAGSFGVGSAARTVSARLLDGTTPVVGEVVTFALSGTDVVSFAGGASGTTAITDSTGLAETSVVPVPGADPAPSAEDLLSAAYDDLVVVWTVRPALIESVWSGSSGRSGLGIGAGLLYAWGNNEFGQLGNGLIDPDDPQNVPLPVLTAGTPMDGATIIAAASGANHSLALDSTGVVYAWGSNAVGQLGTGDTTSSPLPVAVPTVGTPMENEPIVAIAAGFEHSVALGSDGTVYTWGSNVDGQLGIPSATGLAPDIVDLRGKNIVAIAAGGNHTVALTSDETVVAWGRGVEGQLGHGAFASSSVPVDVSLSGVTAIAAGSVHTVALAGGSVYAWGDNGVGQLGTDVTTQENEPFAVDVSVDSSLQSRTVTAVAAGYRHNLALDSTGIVHAWGSNISGEVGIGVEAVDADTAVISYPRLVERADTPMAGKTISRISSGEVTSYATSSDGLSFAWGSNDNGQLGDGTLDFKSNSPVQVQAPAPT